MNQEHYSRLEERILHELAQLSQEVRDIKRYLLGDRFTGKPGIIELVQAHHREIYGDPQYRMDGLKAQLNSNEENIRKLREEQNAIKWIATGWASGISTAISAIGLWIRHLFGK